jgi:hypothetical protein
MQLKLNTHLTDKVLHEHAMTIFFSFYLFSLD